MYYCESGFDMIGRGEIVCDGTGRWETPSFRCEGTSLKPLTTDPSKETNISSLSYYNCSLLF